MNHDHLTEEELVSQLASLCLEGKRLVARVIEHLIAIEDRDVHVRAACDSMWSFCIKRMKMSEGETSRRLNAVKLVRQFPSLLERIARGEIHLSALKLAGPHLDESNADRVFDAMKFKTKSEVREVLAHLFPRPDAPALELEVDGALPTSDGRGFLDPASGRLIKSRIEPLSSTGHLLQLTLTKEGWETYQRAKQLMSHRVAGGDPATIVETALKVLVAKLEKERLGKTSRPQKARRPTKPGTIAAATKREVFERDGFQCTYVDAQGRRCCCKKRLELDHIVPRARGGSDEASNLRVRCKPHNRLWAEEVFGKEHVARAIEARREESKRAESERDPAAVHAPPALSPPPAASPPPAPSTPPAPGTPPAPSTPPAPGTPAAASMISLQTIEQTTRGLLNMGFAKPDVKKAVDCLVLRHRDDAEPVKLPELLREAIATLT